MINDSKRTIDTGNGTYVEGDVDTGGGDFVNRDKVTNFTVIVNTAEHMDQAQAESEHRLALYVGDFPRLPFEPETVLVSTGAFLMGSDKDTALEAPQHEVILPDFRIGRTPVTYVQYAEFIKCNPAQPTPTKPDWFLRQPPEDKTDHPAVGVNWYDAAAYCEWLNQKTGRCYRLPSEAEWEKAARGNGGRRYPWGDNWIDGYANVDSDHTAPVEKHSSGVSQYGCLDMLGNVQEWTRTVWGRNRDENEFSYPYNAEDGREDYCNTQIPNLDRIHRIHRGGSFRSKSTALRCSARSISLPQTALYWRGFRVVLEI